MCRPLGAEQSAVLSYEDALVRLMDPVQAVELVFSLTVSSRGAHLESAHVAVVVAFLQRLHDDGFIKKGAAALEKGKNCHWKHLQVMLMVFMLPGEDAAREVEALIRGHADLPPPPGTCWNIVARTRAENGENITWELSAGCETVARLCPSCCCSFSKVGSRL